MASVLGRVTMDNIPELSTPQEETPEHLKNDPIPRLPEAIWAKMTKEQKDLYIKMARLHLDALEDERRQSRRSTYGYCPRRA